jgi:polygalacturonase
MDTEHGSAVTDHGATGDGLDTKAFQSAIDTAADAGGGTVIVPSGTYVAGGLVLQPNVTLRLEAGATLQASLDPDDYGDRPESVGDTLEYPFLLAEDAEMVSIVGPGTIDGRAREQYDPERVLRAHHGHDHRGLVSDGAPDPRQADFLDREGDTSDWPLGKPDNRVSPALSFVDCEGIRLRDVTLRDMPGHTVFTRRCRDFVASGLTINNDLRVPNSDGIGFADTQDVHISDCTIRGGDDNVTPSSTGDGPPVRNVTVTNCTFQTNDCAIKIGSRTEGTVRDVTVSNCTINTSNRGVGIQHRDGGLTEDVLFSDLTIETTLRKGPWWGKGEPIYVTAIPRNGDNYPGTIRNVRVSNVVADAAGSAFIYGSHGSTVENVRIESLRLKGGANRGAVGAVGGNFDLQPTGMKAPIYEHDVPGIYCQGADGLEIVDTTVEWAPDRPDYCSAAVECVECTDLLLDGVVGGPAQNGNAAVTLQDVEGITVRDCRAMAGTGTFLRLEDTDRERLFHDNDCADADRAIGGEGGFHDGTERD